jgi:hypothetical protein
MSAVDSMIRPWWRGPLPGVGEHLFADCDRLASEGSPRAGVGWLNPHGGSVCAGCFARFDPQESAKRWAVACEH